MYTVKIRTLMDVYAIDLIYLDKCVCVCVWFWGFSQWIVDSLVSKGDFSFKKHYIQKGWYMNIGVRLMNSNGGEIDKCNKNVKYAICYG